MTEDALLDALDPILAARMLIDLKCILPRADSAKILLTNSWLLKNLEQYKEMRRRVLLARQLLEKDNVDPGTCSMMSITSFLRPRSYASPLSLTSLHTSRNLFPPSFSPSLPL
jgi:hypothetical protein